MARDIAIKVSGVSKSFKLPHEKQTSIKGLLVNFTKSNRGYEKQNVLQDVSFEIKKGEFFGIVGRNGSGKSTLLKMLAGIYTPDKGEIITNGSLTPFIELGVGFNPELTGRENVYLNGALLGFNRQEVDAMYEKIVTFAELSRFMDQKLKNYSSGMQVRLAFSIATNADSDILIFDEVLAVGDAKFQQKCLDVFRQLKKAGKTIILVSHSTADIEKFCDRVLVVDSGKSLGVMDSESAIATYEKLNMDTVHTSGNSKRWGSGDVLIDEVTVIADGQSKEYVQFDESFTIEIKLSRKQKDDHLNYVVGLGLYDEDNVNIIGPNSNEEKFTFKKGQSHAVVRYSVRGKTLNPAKYSITVGVFDKNSEKSFDHIVGVRSFNIIDGRLHYGKITLSDSSWSVEGL